MQLQLIKYNQKVEIEKRKFLNKDNMFLYSMTLSKATAIN